MKLGKKSLNLEGFGVGIHETREKKVETWRVLVVFMKRWRPVDRRFAPIDRGRHRFMKPPKPSWEVSTYFFIEYHETTHGIKFLCQKFL